MLWNQIRSVAVLTLGLGLAASASGLAVVSAQDPAPPPGPAAPPAPPTPAAKPSEDAAAEAELGAQRFATRKARLAADMARLARQLAELAVQEHEEVTHRQNLAMIDGEIAHARSNLTRAEDRAAWSAKMAQQGYVSRNAKIADELSLERARFDLEQAQTQREVLVKYTHNKTLKALQAEAARAALDQAAKEAAWERERTREVGLERPFDPS